MPKKKPGLPAYEPQRDPQKLVLEECLPSALFERVVNSVAPEARTIAVVQSVGGDSGFELCQPGILKYRHRPLKGLGKFKLLVHGMTLWVDEDEPDAVVTYLYNAIASELTVECNDNFAIVTSFQSGDLGIHVPRQPRTPPLIDRSEANAAFGALRRRNGHGRK